MRPHGIVLSAQLLLLTHTEKFSHLKAFTLKYSQALELRPFLGKQPVQPVLPSKENSSPPAHLSM